jgi:hypothetical protein
MYHWRLRSTLVCAAAKQLVCALAFCCRNVPRKRFQA